MNYSKRHKFSEWPNHDIPKVAAGAYAIWRNDELLYCGMSGRSLEHAITSGKKKYGLTNRLHSHASGRLSGDQFCVYIANRLVIPMLTSDDLPRFASGELRLDHLTKQLVHNLLEYQYVVVESSKEAFQAEALARSGKTFGQKPLLNPLLT